MGQVHWSSHLFDGSGSVKLEWKFFRLADLHRQAKHLSSTDKTQDLYIFISVSFLLLLLSFHHRFSLFGCLLTISRHCLVANDNTTTTTMIVSVVTPTNDHRQILSSPAKLDWMVSQLL